MSKQVIVSNIPSLQGEPMDIRSSPERGSSPDIPFFVKY
jgi:hypothetical protein